MRRIRQPLPRIQRYRCYQMAEALHLMQYLQPLQVTGVIPEITTTDVYRTITPPTGITMINVAPCNLT